MTVHMDATRVLILVIATLVAVTVYRRGRPSSNWAAASTSTDLLPTITAWAAVVAGLGLLLLPASPTQSDPGADLKPTPAESVTADVAR